MPIEIPAGQSFTFDVVVNASGIGEDEFGFDMFIDHNKTLFIEKIKADVLVLDSGRTEPDWVKN